MSDALPSRALECRPIRERVEGSPYQPGDRVKVVRAIDQEVHDVSRFVGHTGTVEHLEYDCGCGQRYPDVPMVGVKFGIEEDATFDVGRLFWPEDEERLEEFWPEELEWMPRTS